MKKSLLIKLFLLLIIEVVLCNISYGKIVDGIAAIVNNEVITISELNDKLKPYKEKILSSNLSPKEKEKEFIKIRNKILDKLIDDTLILQFGKKLGYNVSDEEVDEVIKNILRKNGITIEQLKEALQENGISFKSYKENLKKEILIARIVNSYVRKNIKIPKAEIDKYIKENFKIDEEAEYHIQQILFLKRNLDKDKEKIQEALNLLKQKVPFSEVAKKFSEGPFKDQGGDLGYFKKKDLLPEIAEALTKMKIGDIKVVKTKLGVHIIKLVDIKSKKQKMSLIMKKAEEELKDKKFSQKLQEWIKELRKNALIIKKI